MVLKYFKSQRDRERKEEREKMNSPNTHNVYELAVCELIFLSLTWKVGPQGPEQSLLFHLVVCFETKSQELEHDLLRYLYSAVYLSQCINRQAKHLF